MKRAFHLKLIFMLIGLTISSCGNDDNAQPDIPEEENKSPIITNISPSGAAVGSEVTIYGENLGSDMDGIAVSFNGIVATSVSLDENGNIVVVVPQGTTDGGVVVTVNDEASMAFNFNVLPSILDFYPVEAMEGDQITISGTSFGDDINQVGVVFGGSVMADDVILNDDGDIVAVVPSGAEVGTITVSIGEESTVSEALLKIYGIYVAGHVNIGDTNIATQWKNGVEEQLSEYKSSAYAVSVEGTDVYAAGYVMKNNLEAIATIWKNGEVFMELTDGSLEAVAVSVAVANGNVYAAGGEWDPNENSYFPKIWNNGEEVLIDEVNLGLARSVFVDGDDFYVGGDERVDGKEEAVYWKNGERHLLESFPYDISTNHTVSSIRVKDGIVYAVGAINNFVANAWTADKDGGNVTSTVLVENEELYSRASSVFVDGNNDVYIVGRYDKKAVIWKNGLMTELPDASDPNFISNAQSICIYNNDIYVAGGDGNAVIWINSQPMLLPTVGESAYAKSVFVH
ncbi:IPT/TIG domain-containing protein [Flagellimonas sp.]|uniref:IPT/TIG domain-containing protein n=1 Tax=Flagellimonas sp. TaxID=2058762 RepID=UPI003BAB5C0A